MFFQDVQGRNGVSRTEADEVLAVLDQLISRNPPQLVHMPPDPKRDKKAAVIKFGLSGTNQVFWAAHPGSVFGAKLVVLPQAHESQEELRTLIRTHFEAIDHGTWKKAHPDDLVPTLEFRRLRFPRDFERVIRLFEEVLAAM
jgi:hypothetical protein